MRRVVRLIPVAWLIVWLAPPTQAVERQLPSAGLIQALVDEVSGEIAFGYTARISQFDRIQASDGWHEAAVWIKGELDRLGYTDAVLEGWPSNGSTRYYTYRTPIGWRARRSELWLVSPRRERLCSFEEMPLTLIKHSGPAHVEAEVVDVGTGSSEDSYRGRDVRGKIVLATGAPGQVAREAMMKRGAAGMIGWYTPEVRPGYPNMVRYTAFWPTWEDRTKVGFGFNVSKLQGWTLKQMLEAGTRVVVRADVEAEHHETRVEALSASVPGSAEPDREILLIGHLCHPTPSANDNGSGSGGLLEMARALRRMVDRGAIRPPARTIRFLWIPEFAGTWPYIKAHLERTRKTLAVINCDMIGENLAKTGGVFTITQTPESMPTYFNDVVVHVARVVEELGLKSINGSDNPFAWRAAPYSGGSDHLVFNDSALKVPAVMFGHGDTFHHTSLDTLDKVDASELRRVCTIALGSVLYLASAGDAEARDIALLVSRNGIGRLSASYHDALATLAAADTPATLQAAYGHVQKVIDHARWRETESVLSTLVYAKGTETTARVRGMTAAAEALASTFRTESGRLYAEIGRAHGLKPGPIVLSEAERAAAQVVPARTEDIVGGPDASYLDEKAGPGSAAALKLQGNAAYEALNFVDGRRTVLDICRSVSAEYGPVPVEDVRAFFQTLEQAGIVTLKSVPLK